MAVTTRTSSVPANPMTRTTRTSSVPAYRSVALPSAATNMDIDIAKKPSSTKQNNAKNDGIKEPSRGRNMGVKRMNSDSVPLGSPPTRRLRSNDHTVLPSSGHIRIGPDYQVTIPARDFVYPHNESLEDHGEVLWDPSLVPIIQPKAYSLLSHLAVDARNKYAIYQLDGLDFILQEMDIYKENYDIQEAALDGLGVVLFSNHNEDIPSIVKNDVVVAIGRVLGNFNGDKKVAFQNKAFDVLSRMLTWAPARRKIKKTT